MLSPLHGIFPPFTIDELRDLYPVFVIGDPAPVATPPDVLLRTAVIGSVLRPGILLLVLDRTVRTGRVCTIDMPIRLVESHRSPAGGAP